MGATVPQLVCFSIAAPKFQPSSTPSLPIDNTPRVSMRLPCARTAPPQWTQVAVLQWTSLREQSPEVRATRSFPHGGVGVWMSDKAATQHLAESGMPVEKKVAWFEHAWAKFTIKIDLNWLAQALTAKSCTLCCSWAWWRIGIIRALFGFQEARGQHPPDGHSQSVLVYAGHRLEARPLGRPCPKVESPWSAGRFCAICPLPRLQEATGS